MKLLSKMFSLSDIKYAWLLILSIVVCGTFFYVDRTSDPDDQILLSIGYSVSFALAVLWSGVNYIGHIRINAMYRKQNDIEAYVEQLAMSGEDKTELRNYLEDYAQDLMNQGKSREEATEEAISQFKVKELLSLSKNTSLFQLHAHYYLFGWAIAAFTLLLLLAVLNGIFLSSPLLLIIAETIFAAYGAAFIFLFFIYKMLDALLYQKLRHHLT